MVKALALFSGGLDSLLAIKVLESQNIDVTAIFFESNFFESAKAKKIADENGIKLIISDIRKEIIELVKNPPSGYGKNLNPCIDCHALMMRKAEEIKNEKGFGFILSGEVLGQRPFSQNKNALDRVEKLSDTEILRPLCAKLLPETDIEKKGLVDRSKLLDISGRSRDRQFALAKRFGIKEYMTPAGGCLLTDPEFSQKLNILMDNWLDFDSSDIELIKNGRVFWLNSSGKILVVIGRNKEECDRLCELKGVGDYKIELADIVGPVAIVRFTNSDLRISNKEFEMEIPQEIKMSELKIGEEKTEEEIIRIVGLLTGYYATKARGKKVKFNLI